MAEPPTGEGGNNTLAAVAIAFLIGVFGLLAFLAMKMSGAEEEDQPKQKGAAPKKRGAMDRMQRGAARAANNADDDEDDDADAADDGGRAGRRDAAKEQKKQEKKAQQAADRQNRQDRDQGKSEKQTAYAARQAEKEIERQKKEEEEQKAREEKEKQEQEEFDKWKEMFAVDAEGEADTDNKDESAVERFIDYVKVRKVVNLEDIAAEFRMKTSSAIDRLEQLEKLDRLSGIFDDRGKYVHITKEEMAGVADWCTKRGRINRADLVAACNRIIRLNPTEEDKAKLEQEAKSAAAALEVDDSAENAAAA